MMAKVEDVLNEHYEKIVLTRKLKHEQTLNYDYPLKRLSLFDGISGYGNDHKVIKRFKIYNIIVLSFLYSNLIRTIIQCLLPEGSIYCIYIGDFKIWWGKPYIAHQVVFLMAVLVVPMVCTLNLTAKDQYKLWCLPFKYMQGLITAEEAKLSNSQQINRLKSKMRSTNKRALFTTFSVNIPYSISVFVTFLLNCESLTHLMLIGIPWSLYEAVWSYFICSNMGLLPGCFDITCFYLRLRYQQIDEQIKILSPYLSRRNTFILKIREKLNKLLSDLDETNADLHNYNKYWSKYVTLVLVSYVPQLLFELYVFIFLPMNESVLLFSMLLNLNIFAMITQIVLLSAFLQKDVSL